MKAETGIYRDEHGVLKLAVWYWVRDPDAGWWRQMFGQPRKLIYAGDVTVDESNADNVTT